VAKESGEPPLTAKAESATADDATDRNEEQDTPQQTIPDETAPPKSATSAEPPDLHSGHKLASRYRLEECITRIDGFSSWRAVDEKLRRAVGIHILPADHARARPVLAAARSAALLGDPRFVQVLDAVEENDLVYVIHEWLPDATELTAVLAAGPLEPHDAYQMVAQVSQGMAAAHREGLAHLRITPGCVLRTESGQYRIRGLAVEAALHGATSERPQGQDTEAIGALLYAAITQRWPYAADEHGLTGLPKDIGLVPPDQVRAGVHRGLSEIAMRALVNDGATASRESQPCATPEELAKAIAGMPKIRPPEPARSPYHRTTYQQGAYGQSSRHGTPPGQPPAATPTSTPPPALPGRTGRALKWSIASLLIVALGLGSWQLADTLINRENQSRTGSSSLAQKAGGGGGGSSSKKVTLRTLAITNAAEYAPYGEPQDPGQAANTWDGNPSTYWRTNSFVNGPQFAPTIKKGVGLIYDLGSKQKVSQADINFLYDGSYKADSYTAVTLYAADSLTTTATPDELTKLASTTTKSKTASLSVSKPVATQYVVVWLTALPWSPADGYYGAGYKQAITDVTLKGQ
jgi:hypothetical protein